MFATRSTWLSPRSYSSLRLELFWTFSVELHWRGASRFWCTSSSVSRQTVQRHRCLHYNSLQVVWTRLHRNCKLCGCVTRFVKQASMLSCFSFQHPFWYPHHVFAPDFPADCWQRLSPILVFPILNSLKLFGIPGISQTASRASLRSYYSEQFSSIWVICSSFHKIAPDHAWLFVCNNWTQQR